MNFRLSVSASEAQYSEIGFYINDAIFKQGQCRSINPLQSREKNKSNEKSCNNLRHVTFSIHPALSSIHPLHFAFR